LFSRVSSSNERHVIAFEDCGFVSVQFIVLDHLSYQFILNKIKISQILYKNLTLTLLYVILLPLIVNGSSFSLAKTPGVSG
jgi:hypothetical protein